jgi:hypothetical protein
VEYAAICGEIRNYWELLEDNPEVEGLRGK